MFLLKKKYHDVRPPTFCNTHHVEYSGEKTPGKGGVFVRIPTTKFVIFDLVLRLADCLRHLVLT